MGAEDNRRGGDKGIRRQRDRDEEDEGNRIKVLAKRKNSRLCSQREQIISHTTLTENKVEKASY